MSIAMKDTSTWINFLSPQVTSCDKKINFLHIWSHTLTDKTFLVTKWRQNIQRWKKVHDRYFCTKIDHQTIYVKKSHGYLKLLHLKMWCVFLFQNFHLCSLLCLKFFHLNVNADNIDVVLILLHVSRTIYCNCSGCLGLGIIYVHVFTFYPCIHCEKLYLFTKLMAVMYHLSFNI